jgi:hypothetical protein
MQKIEYFEDKISGSPAGKEVIRIIQENIREVMNLINKNRAVMTIWQRNHGPEFIKSVLDGGEDIDNFQFQKQINDVSLQDLLLRMADALQDNGSIRLRKLIADYTLPVLVVARDCNSLNEVFFKINNIKKVDYQTID